MAVVEQLIRERDAARAELSPLLDEITRLRQEVARLEKLVENLRLNLKDAEQPYDGPSWSEVSRDENRYGVDEY